MENNNENSVSTVALCVLAAGLLVGAWYSNHHAALMALWLEYQMWLRAFGFLSLLSVAALLFARIWNQCVSRVHERALTGRDGSSVFLGKDDAKNDVYLKQDFRRGHTHVLGTTTSGKTESVILPWIINDIEKGCGMLIVDGKSDSSFLNKLYAYVCQNNREPDFRLFSLTNLTASCAFNPLVGGSPHEVAERVFSAFPIEHSYYRAVQFRVFESLLTLIHDAGQVPTFALIHHLLMDPAELKHWMPFAKNAHAARILQAHLKLDEKGRQEQVSGLEAHIGHFVLSEPSLLFNQEKTQIQFDEVIANNRICYFQLPTLIHHFLGEATGKLVLQSFEASVGKVQTDTSSHSRKFFSCFLDDFQDYLYPRFASLLNKSASAGVGVVLSHQSLGDLDKVGPYFRDEVVSCTNVKVFMRINDPKTVEECASVIGTQVTEKTTERQKKGFFGPVKTGDGSTREVNEFAFHPNLFKTLPRGRGIVRIAHPGGVKSFLISFAMRPPLPKVVLPSIEKSPVVDTCRPKAVIKPSSQNQVS